jgi:hypothetical protein
MRQDSAVQSAQARTIRSSRGHTSDTITLYLTTNNKKRFGTPGNHNKWESMTMALIVKIAQIVSQLNAALSEAMQARQAAHRKYPFVPEE